MRKWLIIAFLSGVSSPVVYAQLLEDTDRKLKNAKVERKGFLFFRNKKKAKNSSGIPSAKGEASPRYSGSGKKIKKYPVTERSPGGVFKFKSVIFSPRYSSGSPFGRNSYKISPRYSSDGNPFRGRSYKVITRYSPANPFRGSDYKVSPRYSAGTSPFRGNRYKAAARYSPGIPFRGDQYKLTTRYSPGIPFSGSKHRVSPRYSYTSPKFKTSGAAFSPSAIRYAQGMPFRGRAYSISPRYTGSRYGFFKQIGSSELAVARRYRRSSLWEGEARGTKLPDILYRWDKLWSRLNGNRPEKKGIKDPGRKAKFDKKERVIWNN